MKTNFYGLTIFYKSLILLTILLLLSAQSVLAQSTADVPVLLNEVPEAELVVPSIPQFESNTPGADHCFDYYTFGSVQVDMAPMVEEAYTTDSLYFAGELTNNNPYPLVDGQVWMKVFKLEQEDDDFLKENGYPLVDFVLIEDNIALSANEVRPIDFEWTVPTYAAEGEYQSAFFFTTAHRYNLLGLSFTDYVVGNTFGFEIKSANPYTPVVFNKNSVRLNDTRTSFALPPRVFEGTQAVTAYATLVNDSDEERRVELSWTSYKWDGLQTDSVQDEKKETVQIPSKSSIEVTYETPIRDTAVTFVVAEVIDGDAKSILNIRYVRDEVGETRINFPSTFTYPLTEGEEATMFSCVHSTNEPVVPDNELTLTLKDVNNNILHSYVYKGDITGAMMGIKDSFVPKQSYGSFSLTATLSSEGKLVETVTTRYNCEDLDPSLCTEADKVVDPTTQDSDDSQMLVVLLITLLLLILAGLVYYRLKIKGTRVPDPRVVDDLGGSDNNN